MNLAPYRAIRTRLREAFAVHPDERHSDFGWYRPGSSTQDRRRDLSAYTRRQLVERAIAALDRHPLAARYVSLINEWIAPEQIRPSAPDPIVNAAVTEFWEDPRNDWEWLLPRANSVKLAVGNLYLPARLGFDGSVILDWFDPADVVDVAFEPGSNRVAAAVLYAPPGYTTPKPIPVIRPVRDKRDLEYGRMRGVGVRPTPDGEVDGVLLFRWNCLPNSAFGRSDYTAAMDPWTVLDDYHSAIAERAQLLARLVGDIEVDGGQAEVDGVRDRYRSEPQYATMPVHNKAEKWNVGVPSSGAADAAANERLLRTYGSASVGIPPHILSGDFTEGNRAVATSALDPAYLRARAKADELAAMVKTCCRYAVDSARAASPGRFAPVLDWTITVTVPSLLRRDPAEAVNSLAALVNVLTAALGEKLIDRETAREVFADALGDASSRDIDPAAVLERLGSEATAPAGPATPPGILASLREA